MTICNLEIKNSKLKNQGGQKMNESFIANISHKSWHYRIIDYGRDGVSLARNHPETTLPVYLNLLFWSIIWVALRELVMFVLFIIIAAGHLIAPMLSKLVNFIGNSSFVSFFRKPVKFTE